MWTVDVGSQIFKLCLMLAVVNPMTSSAVETVFKAKAPTKSLGVWNQQEWKKTFGGGQRSFFNALPNMTKSLDSTELAEVDLLNLYSGAELVARYPRSLIVRDWVKVEWQGTGLSFQVKPLVKILLPLSVLNVKGITRIELTNTQLEYPNTRLKNRTNPAACRGEKFFMQNCMTCHGLPNRPAINAQRINQFQKDDLNLKHEKFWDNPLNDKDFRGLQAYGTDWKPVVN